MIDKLAEEFVGTIHPQNCGDSLLVLERSEFKRGTNSLWKCQFIKCGVVCYKVKTEILRGNIQIPYDLTGQIFEQKCGDSLKVIKKTNQKNNNGDFLWEIEFIKYPFKDLKPAKLIRNGECFNPQIEIEEFVKKEWLQHCGDSLKIIKKTNKKKQNSYLWECEFIKYPCIILANKEQIIRGAVLNPQIEKENFIGKIYPQKCGDSLKVIEKGNIKKDNSYLYKVFFIQYPYITFAKKDLIIKGEIINYNYPDQNKNLLRNFIINNFDSKPTLQELANSLRRGYSTIMHKINEFELRDCIQYCPISKQEEEIRQYCINLDLSTLKQATSKELNGQEIDIYIPNKFLGIEFNGNIWHSNHPKLGILNQNYHQEKSLLAQEKGLFLMHIFEYEWFYKKEIIKSLICCKMNSFNVRIGARKCNIRKIKKEEYQNFCENNHLQGYCFAKIRLGLFYKDELIQVMSFDNPRFTDKYEWEIIRECSKLGYCIIGGKEKLWSYFIKNYFPNSVISYCDFSKFTGNSYLRLGFKKERLNKPGFVWWEKDNIIYTRNPSKHQEMKKKGYYKIYDAGQLVFSWSKKN
jgi:hypothetical protein